MPYLTVSLVKSPLLTFVEKINMKKIYLPLMFLAAGFFALSNSNGAGTAQGQDRTGSPVGNGSCANTGCHNGGNFSPSVSLTLLDDNNNAVSAYVPGDTYTLQVTTNASNDPVEYGFQATALLGDNAEAGSFTDGDGYKLLDLAGRGYVEQESPQSSPTFNVTWTAPAAGAGSVSFYSSTVAANNANGSGGDNGATATPLAVEEDTGSSTQEPGVGKMQLTIAPNPVGSTMAYNAVGRQNGTYTVSLTDAFGKIVKSETVNLTTGENRRTLEVNDLAKGVYILQITGKNYFAAERMLKL